MIITGDNEDRLLELLKACATDPETFATTTERRDVGRAVGPGHATDRTKPAIPTVPAVAAGSAGDGEGEEAGIALS